MSVRMMSQVWDRTDLDATERLVMLSLADHADDEGVCYPSIARLCERTSLKDRAVQMAIKRLCERGLLSVDRNAGRKGANVFTIKPAAAPNMRGETVEVSSGRMPDAHGRFAIYRRDGNACVYCGYQSPDGEENLTLDHVIPRSRGGAHSPDNLVTCCMDCNRSKKNKTPAEWEVAKRAKTPHQMHPALNAPPASYAPNPRIKCATPPASNAPEPSKGTIIETSGRAPDPILDILSKEASPEAITSFIAYRRKSKGKALTVTAAKRLAAHLRDIRARGGDPDDALGMAEERVWLTVEPDWYFRNKASPANRPTDDRKAKWQKLAGTA